MARPKMMADEEILEVAHKILRERGPDEFSVADLARRTGMSRAAITSRFESGQKLRAIILREAVDRFIDALGRLEITRGGDGLLTIAAFIGRHASSGRGPARFFSNYQSTLQNAELRALEERRGQAYRGAIASAMPATRITRDAAVDAFAAHISGSIVAWIASEEQSAEKFLIERTKQWLTLAAIPYTDGESG